jgi:hypothetical protein
LNRKAERFRRHIWIALRAWRRRSIGSFDGKTKMDENLVTRSHEIANIHIYIYSADNADTHCRYMAEVYFLFECKLT